ncbi:nitroreductase family protein [Nocardioides dongkuii]|uniref:nitroreductase family protein n=1 Tax=Nocardioides dongkuii TaxID=2760089 RepID=UPI0015F846BE|nr:nitroreductase family protein [Nocardioides dongkuii]
MSLKSRVGKTAPRWVVRRYRRYATALEFVRDYRDYAASTAWDMGAAGSDDRRDDQEALESRLIIGYHGLEKGTSFPAPRRPYGAARRAEIDQLLALSKRKGYQLRSESHARSAVASLDDFNANGSFSDEVTPVSNWDGSAHDYESVARFVGSRHSVRNFDTRKPVDLSIIRRVVELAGSTPSVCNRRSYRAHYFDDRDSIDSLLSLHNGNSGFGHTVPGLFVVTERRSSFVGAGERNQRWIDGGLFAMTLVWVAHALGLGTCLLNWSQPNAQSDRLRKAAAIPNSEDIIVMIAVGHPAPGHRVPRSPRRPTEEIFVHH